ncbi:MAG: hypothetical protein K2F83_04525, partial [Oscillospiraceae bacterium]|nr:hypothetical protein [Oscillospiraceae bacterium]
MNGPQNDLDHAAFQRVWRRVMPQDRIDCPFTLDDPAEETAAAVEPTTAAPEPTPQTEPEAPVGAMTSLAIPAMPPVPAPTSMSMPAPRQSMPGMAPSPCLGESAAGELPTLEALLAMVREGRQVYRGLTRSARSRTAQMGLLADLIAAKEHQ